MHSTDMCQGYRGTKFQNLAQTGSGSKSRPEMFIFQGLRFDLASSSGDELTYGTNCIQETYVQGTFKPNFRI